MRKSAFACIITAFLLPENALADNAEGIIKNINEKANTLTLTVMVRPTSLPANWVIL
ncbi:MAG: hypothetical protein JSC189_000237 [Candidatus Tokpelaia sp. JSC189]|nr:MAG: hypothetical protein JSC189_000237 [Candidatus Tokpelaia sp. JSC189]